VLLPADPLELDEEVEPDDEVPIVGHIDCVPGELFVAAHVMVLLSQTRPRVQSESLAQCIPAVS